MNDHTRFMQRALELAKQGEGHVEPNPMVGCVLVRDGQIIAEGWHQKFGGPHAEINAINNCQDPRSATAYVTLEPCSHHGKTGPCVDALIQAGIANVVIGTEDPNPQVNGRGVSALKAAGIAVESGICRPQADALIAPFAKRMLENRPWVIAKWAMTLDGKIATASGSSQWISNERSREIVHQIRGRVDAILVGVGTVIADDPLMTARPPGPRIQRRVVMDSQCRTPLDCRLVKTANEHAVIIGVSNAAPANAVQSLRRLGCDIHRCGGGDRQSNLISMLEYLSEQGCTNVLVEGGSEVLGTLNDANLIDEIHCFVAPKIAGGESALTAIAGLGIGDMNAAKIIENPTIEPLESDVYIHGRLAN